MRPKTRAIRYLRVSTPGQNAEDRYGPERQRVICARSEIKHNLETVAEISDNISGAINERAGLERIPELALQHGATAISLSELDRLSRDIPGGYALLDRLLKLGLDIYSADMRTRVNFKDIESVKEVNDKLREAHLERKRILDRTHNGRIAKAISGKTVRRLNLYGYQNGEIYEPQAMWVRRVFELALTQGIFATVTTLEEAGAPSPSRVGKGWRPHHVRDILLNETYKGKAGYGLELHCHDCGETRSGSSWDGKRGYGSCERCGKRVELIRYYTDVPALVTPEAWQMAQDARERRQRQPGKRGKRLDTYPITGRAFCGACGRAMNGMRARNNRYYACSNARRNKDNPCNHRHYYRTDEVHEAIHTRLQELCETPGALESAFAAQDTDPHAADRQRTEAARQDLNTKLERVEEGYLAGVLSVKTAIDQRKSLEAKLAALPTLAPFVRPKRDLEAYRSTVQGALLSKPLAEVVDTAGLEVVFEPDRSLRLVIR